MDKNYTKQLAAAEGILTPQWRAVKLTDREIEEVERSEPLPCVVKIHNGGSSVGVFICRTGEELHRALRECRRFGRQALIEQFVEGRDFFCGVLDGESLPPIEVIPKTGFYDYKNKYVAGASLEVCPAQVDGKAEAQMRSAARRIHELLGLAAYSRSDFVLDRDNRPWFLEVNTLPGMTDTSLLPKKRRGGGCGLRHPVPEDRGRLAGGPKRTEMKMRDPGSPGGDLMEAITIREIMEVVGGRMLGEFHDLDRETTRVETDSRTIHEGSLFVPCPASALTVTPTSTQHWRGSRGLLHPAGTGELPARKVLYQGGQHRPGPAGPCQAL